MKLKKIFALVFCFATIACNSSNSQNNPKKNVSGIIKGSNKQQLSLEMLSPAGFKQIAFVNINEDGSFAFEAPIKEIAFYRISLTPQNFLIFIADSTSNLNIESSAAELNNPNVKISGKGSEESVKLAGLQKEAKANYFKMDSLQKAFTEKVNQQNDQTLGNQIRAEYDVFKTNQTMIAKNFVSKNLSSFASLSALEMVDADKEIALYKEVDKNLSAKYPNSEYVVAFHKKVIDMTRLAIGSPAPEIIANKPDGKPMALSSLKGKLVVIDFWASWCRPCRAENPNVVKMYNKYHDKGLEIFSVSLDSNKDSWIEAIKKDGLVWNHVSDLQQWQSVPAKTYGVTGIPMTYLIDKNGNILAKGLRGEELEAKVAELLK